MFDPTRSEILSLLEDAIRAPSADNRHHVRFRIDAQGVSLFVDDEFLHARVAHRRFLTLLSFGAVVENLRVALSVHGWTFEPAWFPSSADPALLLDLRWDRLALSPRPDPLAGRLASRHTNRKFFEGPVVSDAEREALEAAVRDVASIELGWFDTKPRRSALLGLMRLAETARFRTRRHHAELFESIAFEAGWQQSVDERLAPGSLEVERPARLPFQAFRHWPLMRAATWFGAHHLLGLRAADLPTRRSPHLMALTSALPPDRAALEGGRAFQRLWLAADQLDLALQPMVAAAVLTHDEEAPDVGPSILARRLREGWQGIVGSTYPIVVFRLGRAAQPSVRSGRRPLSAYLVEEP